MTYNPTELSKYEAVMVMIVTRVLPSLTRRPVDSAERSEGEHGEHCIQ
jgi:hypothetical protein